MSIEVLVKVLMDEQSEWAKVPDDLWVMLTTMFTFTTAGLHRWAEVNLESNKGLYLVLVSFQFLLMTSLALSLQDTSGRTPVTPNFAESLNPLKTSKK